MRTYREIELLKAKDILKDQIKILLNKSIIDINLYKKFFVKYYLCKELLITERKRKLKIS